MVSTIAATLYIGLARTSLDNPVILAVESFKVTSYKFQFSDETMFIFRIFWTAFTDKQIIATPLN